ncbi:MAG: arginine--tRNA ligase [Desulfurococcales archaeon]|nr:arginine--tRNA ligase [Desulfurococcales archaeon]
MTTPDPYSELIESVAEALVEIVGIDERKAFHQVRLSDRPGYGDLSLPLLRYTRTLNIKPDQLFESLKSKINSKTNLLSDHQLVRGYHNMYIDESKLALALSNTLREYGRLEPPKTRTPMVLVVEHTSANPIHPLHMGHARNTSLGDTLARLLKARGHRVNTRFYIDDVGRQMAVLALGVKLLGGDPLGMAKRLDMKPDKLLGYIYSITHLLLDIHKLTQSINDPAASEEEKLYYIRERDKLAARLVAVSQEAPGEIADKLIDAFSKLKETKEPEREVSEIMRSYENRLDEGIVSLIRETANASLKGFRETLSKLGVEFDNWDWESDLVWTGLVSKLIEEASKSPYVTVHKDALAIDLSPAMDEQEVREKIKIPKALEIPPLILVRSDGTTLYTTRDMAYTLYKFRQTGANKVVNVIGADQRLPQIQIRLALYLLGYKREALNTIHYAYEIVRLPGMRMSSRKGVFLGLDEVLDQTYNVALSRVEEKSPDLPLDEKEKVALKIAVGAIRYTMIATDPMRPIEYNVDRATNLDSNSGPYLQYTYARANGILRKAGEPDWDRIDYRAASDPTRRGLLIAAAQTPYYAAKAADDMEPVLLANHLLKLADRFNSWYQKDQVIREKEEETRNFKILLTIIVREALGMGLDLLGIPKTPRM